MKNWHQFVFYNNKKAEGSRLSQNTRRKGAFHYAKDSGNLVGYQMEKSVSVSSDRNIRDHLWRWSTYFGWNIPTEIRRSIFTNRFFALIREFGKGIKSGKSHSYWLVRFNRKMSFHFPSVFPLISDRSVWQNGKHPKMRETSIWREQYRVIFA